MRRTAGLSFLAGAAVLMSAVDGYGCGDKFLVVGRGVRYARVKPAAHPASVLIYMNPASKVPVAAKDVQLESRLKQAGHTVQKAGNAAQLVNALKSKQYDLVLADIADSPALEEQVASEPYKPVVVPILYNPTDDQLTAARRQYGCAMKAPNKDPLAAIDEAILQKRGLSDAKAANTR